MAHTAILGSAEKTDEYGWLRFDQPTYQPEFGCTCTFARAGDETSATFTMLDHFRDALVDFAAALARPDLRQDAPLVWESEDSDVRLAVTADGSHNRVNCVMRRAPDWAPQDLGWITVEPADLRAFAMEMHAFVTGS